MERGPVRELQHELPVLEDVERLVEAAAVA